MEIRVEIKEAKVSVVAKPWKVALIRHGEYCDVSVLGPYGDKKALFIVLFDDLVDGILELGAERKIKESD